MRALATPSVWLIAVLTRSAAVAAVTSSSTAPVIALQYGSFRGSTSGNITSFLGIPYAQAPIGDLRFALPQPPQPFEGVYDATSYGAACYQQANNPPALDSSLPFNLSSGTPLANESEDCLFINVLKPASAAPGDNLPVLFWIYGGGFEQGDSSLSTGNEIVERSLVLGEHIIFVSVNYRLNAFGFLASEEVLQAGLTNIGLRDQRYGMQWVNQYISAFGGDPSKVTIWGESAGAFSVGFQLVINNGDPEGLFRAAVMESGSPYALRNVSAGQPYYDFLVDYTGCVSQADTLACLRQAPAEQILAAVNMTPNSRDYTEHNLAWQPRLDGDLLVQNPQRSVLMGQYAKVPIISGDCDDEGTLFSLGNINITYLPDASPIELLAVGVAYPQDPILGSPFDTGNANELTPQFKRMAAFTGDWQFESPRRLVLETMSRTQDAWAYLFRRGKSRAYLGAYHSSDLSEFFSDVDYIGMDALVNFATNLDPNAAPGLAPNISYLSGVNWEQWGSNPAAPPLLTFQDPTPSINFTADTFRDGPTALLATLALQMP
ncbi:sterol esterase [Fomitopsis serialis]|uniref:sterol esterase n=1 Tax=Fomitopsis serialis TaxID=139415 RepID=UPI0020087DFB|nr:sterol esterase [Neoantrodia serialis]KAH9929250.1 sterol esterase [Neoantrodia serialis]